MLERALGAEHFASLRRELGTYDSYRMTEAQAEAVVRLQLGQLAALDLPEEARKQVDRELGRGKPARQLQQRQRVTPRLGHDAVAYRRVKWPGKHRIQQGARIVLAQTLEHQLRQSR